MTPDQLKAARALLGWSLDRLAARSGASVQMVKVFEHNGRIVSSRRRDLAVPTGAVDAIRTALEQAGVMFTNGDEPGVKLRKPDL
jgi:transcriptional regulator with XRE-family HTH domain